jgi:hypothetical protein
MDDRLKILIEEAKDTMSKAVDHVESELKLQGVWEEYNDVFINDNVDNLIKEFEVWFEEYINSSNEDFITEAGDVERWVGSAKNKMLESKEETLKFLKALKK